MCSGWYGTVFYPVQYSAVQYRHLVTADTAVGRLDPYVYFLIVKKINMLRMFEKEDDNFETEAFKHLNEPKEEFKKVSSDEESSVELSGMA